MSRARARHRAAASTRSTSWRSRCRTRTRCTRSLRERGSYLVGPLARYALNLGPALAAGARGRRGGRASARCAATRSGASWSARSRSSTRSTRRSGSSTATSEPDRPAVEVAPRAGTGYGWTRGAARDALAPLHARRARARSSTPRSCRPPRRTSGRSRRTCARSCERNLDLADEPLQLRCEQAIRNYDPCISCATHFLTLDRGPADDRPLVIGIGNEWRERRRGRAGGRAAPGRAGVPRCAWPSARASRVDLHRRVGGSGGGDPGRRCRVRRAGPAPSTASTLRSAASRTRRPEGPRTP